MKGKTKTTSLERGAYGPALLLMVAQMTPITPVAIMPTAAMKPLVSTYSIALRHLRVCSMSLAEPRLITGVAAPRASA